MVLLVGGTFEARYESHWPVVGILGVATVVVLADGIGWTATAIFRALYDNDHDRS